MSSYVHEARLSERDQLRAYREYLQHRSFAKGIQWEVSKNALSVVASIEDLKKENVRCSEALRSDMREGFDEVSEKLDQVDSTLNKGFITLHFDLQSIESSVRELSAKFDWGIDQLLTAIGGVNDSLATLIKIAKTPEQVWAYEQFSIAHDALRQQLYDDALEHVTRAIEGHQSHTGYKLEHRFHYFLGTIHLGSYTNFSEKMVDLAKAEEAFLNAAKYARAKDPQDTGRALCAAGYAAYRKLQYADAQKHTEHALLAYPQLPEAHYQKAKLAFDQKQAERGLASLRTAIKLDKWYAVKSGLRDGFDKALLTYSRPITGLIVSLRDEHALRCSRYLRDFEGQLQEATKNTPGTLTGTMGKLSAAEKALREAAKSLREQTYFGALAASNQLKTCGDMLTAAAETGIQEARAHFIQRGTSIQGGHNSSLHEIDARQRALAKDIETYQKPDSTSGSRIGGYVAIGLLIFFNVWGLVAEPATRIPTFIIANIVLVPLCLGVGWLVNLIADSFVVAGMRQELASMKSLDEGKKRKIDADLKQTLHENNRQMETTFSRYNAVIAKVQNAFSDTWWGEALAQYRSGGAAKPVGVVEN